jgi:hypothetical protein
MVSVAVFPLPLDVVFVAVVLFVVVIIFSGSSVSSVSSVLSGIVVRQQDCRVISFNFDRSPCNACRAS